MPVVRALPERACRCWRMAGIYCFFVVLQWREPDAEKRFIAGPSIKKPAGPPDLEMEFAFFLPLFCRRGGGREVVQVLTAVLRRAARALRSWSSSPGGLVEKLRRSPVASSFLGGWKSGGSWPVFSATLWYFLVEGRPNVIPPGVEPDGRQSSFSQASAGSSSGEKRQRVH